MPEPTTSLLAGSATLARLAAHPDGVAPAPDGRGARPQRRDRVPVEETRPRRRSESPATSSPTQKRGWPCSRTRCARSTAAWSGSGMGRRCPAVTSGKRCGPMVRRSHRERLPAEAPALNPSEGLWQQRTGVERRYLWGVTRPPLRPERRAAVIRVRRQLRLIKRFCQGATR
jgi:hypothetical protein